MDTFGRKLQQAIESRGLSIEEVAQATGLSVEQVRALERDDFGALPGGETVKEGLRSFARLLDVDADDVIADYNLEREWWLATLPAESKGVEKSGPREEPGASPRIQAEAERTVESRVAEESDRREDPQEMGPPRRNARDSGELPSGTLPGRGRRMAALAVACIALAVTALVFLSRPSPSPPPDRPIPDLDQASAGEMAPSQANRPSASQGSATAGEVAKRRSGPAVAAAGMEPRPAAADTAIPDSKEPSHPVAPSAGVTGLRVAEFGTGRGVAGHELVGETDRFAEGERVWFWTRIEGGAAGMSIEHVWLHDGEEVIRVPLNVGGSRWRTQSYKDLGPGSGGRWAVEARDASGRVLARREFVCVAGHSGE
ncbi:MAG TPA: DUF2914 domain-containing protein [Candidatus Saccharimonadales bacterium]|nr:DUF2914 domain-containing protein [Candidatus Saccharimonadales bacterium]